MQNLTISWNCTLLIWTHAHMRFLSPHLRQQLCKGLKPYIPEDIILLILNRFPQSRSTLDVVTCYDRCRVCNSPFKQRSSHALTHGCSVLKCYIVCGCTVHQKVGNALLKMYIIPHVHVSLYKKYYDVQVAQMALFDFSNPHVKAVHVHSVN